MTVFTNTSGDQVFTGTAGEYDQIDYVGALLEYTISRAADGTITISHPSIGTDTATEIDGFWFTGDSKWYSLEEAISLSGGTDSDTNIGTDGVEDTFDGSDSGDSSYDGAGNEYDQVNYDSASTDYTFTENADGSITVAKPDGTDTLNSIDGIWFQGDQKWMSIDDILDGSGGGGNGGGTGTAGVMDVFDGTGAGDNNFDGAGSEYDQVDYAGSASDYTFTKGADGMITVVKPDGTDMLTSIDGFWFNGEQKWYSADDLVNTDGGHGGDDVSKINATFDQQPGIKVTEGQVGKIRVRLDEAVTEDTWVTIRVNDGTAQLQDTSTHETHSYFHESSASLARVMRQGNFQNTWSDPKIGGKDLDQDFSIFANGRIDNDGFVSVLVKAGSNLSEYFEVRTQIEAQISERSAISAEKILEGNEEFTLEIVSIDNHSGHHIDVKHGDKMTVTIQDQWMSIRVASSPIVLDLGGDGEIGVTGETSSFDKDLDAEIGATVEFDIDGDGTLDTIEWVDGSGDGILVDTSKIGADGSIDGNALFGDQGGEFANGYEKLALLDTNGDGIISGDELVDLAVWIDDGDAVLEAGELVSISDAGIVSISAEAEIVLDEEGRTLIQSSATDADGNVILTEDVWFSHDDLAENAEDSVAVSEPDAVVADEALVAEVFDVDYLDYAMI